MTHDLPLPPSTNSLFATDFKTKRRFISKGYASWKKAAASILAGHKPLAKPYAVHILVNINYTGDVENRLKAICDALVDAGIICDDRYIDSLRIDRDRSVEACRVEVYSLAQS